MWYACLNLFIKYINGSGGRYHTTKVGIDEYRKLFSLCTTPYFRKKQSPMKQWRHLFSSLRNHISTIVMYVYTRKLSDSSQNPKQYETLSISSPLPYPQALNWGKSLNVLACPGLNFRFAFPPDDGGGGWFFAFCCNAERKVCDTSFFYGEAKRKKKTVNWVRK